MSIHHPLLFSYISSICTKISALFLLPTWLSSQLLVSLVPHLSMLRKFLYSVTTSHSWKSCRFRMRMKLPRFQAAENTGSQKHLLQANSKTPQRNNPVRTRYYLSQLPPGFLRDSDNPNSFKVSGEIRKVQSAHLHWTQRHSLAPCPCTACPSWPPWLWLHRPDLPCHL